VPDQVVAYGEHLVLFAEGYVCIGGFEVVGVCLGLDYFPLQNIFGGDAVELRFYYRVADGVGFEELRGVQGYADFESIFVGFFQRWLLGKGQCGDANKNKREQISSASHFSCKSPAA
jgi:hypothetical protein